MDRDRAATRTRRRRRRRRRRLVRDQRCLSTTAAQAAGKILSALEANGESDLARELMEHEVWHDVLEAVQGIWVRHRMNQRQGERVAGTD